MVTRREFTQGSMLALFMVFLAASKQEQAEASEVTMPAVDPTDRVDMLLVSSGINGNMVRVGRKLEGVETAYRFWAMDRDFDGTWSVYADSGQPTDDDSGGSITVYDPKVAAFLEQFHKLMEDPDTYGDVTI